SAISARAGESLGLRPLRLEHSGHYLSRLVRPFHRPWPALRRRTNLRPWCRRLHDPGDALLDRHVSLAPSRLRRSALEPRISHLALQPPHMKFCRFVALDSSKARFATPVFGVIEDESVVEISDPPWLPWSRTT